MTKTTEGQSAKYWFSFRAFGRRISCSTIYGHTEHNPPPYMTRIIVEREDGSSRRLHVIQKADGERCLHDHPWAFRTFLLWGSYVEEFEEEYGWGPYTNVRRMKRRVGPWRFHDRPSEFKHRITDIRGGWVVTLVRTGPKDKEWGFYTNEGKIHWLTFIKAGFNKAVAWCSS